jgi:DNA repair exonuclease SbcCD ATPase subunit
VKNVRIHHLELSNFKGIEHFGLCADGKDCVILGDNATGKTTLADSFFWLLFGKDSLNQANFEIKTLDASGEAKHGLEHKVQATIDVDGKRLELRKVYAEKWQKKRGSAEKEFTGHTTDYFIDDVPKSKKEYEACIAAIADEQLFKLLTNPRYFNEVLHWQKRREMLLAVCGDITDSEVIASDKSLSGLPAILGDRKLEDHRKVIAADRARINKTLEQIPVRISECQGGIVQVDPSFDGKILKELKAQLKAKQEELTRIETGGEIAEKTKQLRMVESQLIDLENKKRPALNDAIKAKIEEVSKQHEELIYLDRESRTLASKIQAGVDAVAELDASMAALRQLWSVVNAAQFTFEQSSTCPTCGQDLPESKLDEAREKALAAFNARRAEDLAKIQEKGKTQKAEKEGLEKEIVSWKDKINQFAEQMATIRAKIESLEDEIKSPPSVTPSKQDAKELADLTAKKNELEASIFELQIGSNDAIAEVKAQIEELESAIDKNNGIMVQIEHNKSAFARLEELKAQERTLAAQFEKLEKELYLTETFIRRKVELLEERINGRFKLARFKMFNEQVNGGLQECCEVMVNGVPYSSLNNAMRINIGLDICNTLSEHHGLSLPVWIDNSESITQVLSTESQQIRLVVSEHHKTLTVQGA